MNEKPTSLEEVYRSSEKGCSQYRLVLEAVGIPFHIHQDADESTIIVPTSYAAQARNEIDAYTRENQTSLSEEGAVLVQGNGRAGVLGYALVLVVVFLFQRQGILSEHWLDAGKTHGGLICQGEWWRAATALSLHSDLTHLVANVGFGGLIGLFVGQLLGFRVGDFFHRMKGRLLARILLDVGLMIQKLVEMARLSVGAPAFLSKRHCRLAIYREV